MQAIGSILFGYISDKYCRKKTLIVTQILGGLIIGLILSFGFVELTIVSLGLLFCPTPIARAALIDNFPHESKIKLIAVTFIFQFIPWCFYVQLSKLNILHSLFLIISILSLNLFFTLFFFRDRRDKTKKNLEHHLIPTQNLIVKNRRKKALFTLIPFLAAEAVFFLSDAFFEKFKENAPFFAALGIGNLLGSIMSMLYRKTPHLSTLTITYCMGFIFALLSLVSALMLPFSNINLSYQLVLYSILGGIYLPFVYDIILSTIPTSFRGTACGIIEMVISIAAFIGLGTVSLIHPKEEIILSMMIFLFLFAAILQKNGENYG